MISTANYPARVIATNKDNGKVVWETNLHDQPDVQITAAPLAVKDKIIVGAAGGDRGVRDWIAALDAATGKLVWRKYVIPAPGEPGSETWKDKNNAWQIGGGAMWITGSYDPATNQVIWGTGNPVPMFDPTYRPGDNLYTNSMISWNPDNGNMNWYFQYVPGDMWDYDEAHSHILIDGQVGDQPRKLITHSARNGFLYTFERSNGQTLLAKPYVENINWTKGIDQKTGKPVDYDPKQGHPGLFRQAEPDAGGSDQEAVPVDVGRQQLLAGRLQPEDQAALHPVDVVLQRGDARSQAVQQGRRLEGRHVQEHRAQRDRSHRRRSLHRRGEEARCAFPIPTTAARSRPAAASSSPASPTERSSAYDDTTMEPLWKINVGTGFNAPPMTFEVNGKQYVAILSGLSPISKRRHSHHAGAAGAAQPDHAVRVRVVTKTGRERAKRATDPAARRIHRRHARACRDLAAHGRKTPTRSFEEEDP